MNKSYTGNLLTENKPLDHEVFTSSHDTHESLPGSIELAPSEQEMFEEIVARIDIMIPSDLAEELDRRPMRKAAGMRETLLRFSKKDK